MQSLTQLPEWQALLSHQQTIASAHVGDLLRNDAERAEKFSLHAASLFLDYSKNHINEQTKILLCKLAKASHLSTQIEAMFDGQLINTTEQQAALHVALRNPTTQPIFVNHQDVMPAIHNTLTKMANFTQQIHQGEWRGFSQQPITDIVNIGIGGSDLGPNMAIEALAPYAISSLRFHFVSNIDHDQITQTLKKLNPATTLFIISSKSFTTAETLTNAQTALCWFQQTAPTTTNHQQHFLAITHHPDRAIAFGIAPNNIFTIDAWVGGRYSLWSAIGLPIMLAIGEKNFRDLLRGAYAMDQHFRSAPFEQNMPVILALLSIWYGNFFGSQARAILPYSQALKQLPTYLQQLEMESSGKHCTHEGQTVNYTTGTVIFGETGTNGQHTFCQLLHQGTLLVPVDFIVPLQNHSASPTQQATLVANAFSQSKALAEGEQAKDPYKTLAGNHPSNTLLLPKLTPTTLGELIALYEHKVFTQSVIWQINAFDQWGVEYGKHLTNLILPSLQNINQPTSQYDSSTRKLIEHYRKISLSKS